VTARAAALDLEGVAALDPVHAAHDHLRRVDGVAAAGLGIGFLATGEFRVGELVGPADVVPVIDMQRQGDHAGFGGQFAQIFIGGRAGRAALRVVKLHHRAGHALRHHLPCPCKPQADNASDDRSRHVALRPLVAHQSYPFAPCAANQGFARRAGKCFTLPWHDRHGKPPSGRCWIYGIQLHTMTREAEMIPCPPFATAAKPTQTPFRRHL
jgi:hypothetical protein